MYYSIYGDQDEMSTNLTSIAQILTKMEDIDI